MNEAEDCQAANYLQSAPIQPPLGSVGNRSYSPDVLAEMRAREEAAQRQYEAEIYAGRDERMRLASLEAALRCGPASPKEILLAAAEILIFLKGENQ